MKKSFLLMLICTALSLTLSAQITINSSDIIAIGFVADQTTDTLPDATIVQGGTGNINWDFTNLKFGENAQFVFFQPETTPYSASFPNANLASRVEEGLYAYMVKDDNRISIVGIEGKQTVSGFSIEGKLTLTPGQSLIRFPANYQDSYDETIVQKGQVTGAEVGFPSFDSIRLEVTVMRSVEIDAYGTMETPSGSYETFRSSESETSSTEIFILSNGVWAPFTTLPAETVINYNWWTKNDDGLAFPVVQMIYNPAEDSREVTWLLNLTDVENLFELEANLYPNPASSHLNIEFAEPFTGKIDIFSLDGRLRKAQNADHSTSELLNLTDFQAGIYLLVLKDKAGKLVGHQKIEIIK